MPRSKGRTGRPYRRLREYIRRTQPFCHVCGDPIPQDAAYPDPLSFTVDHIEPLSHGGEPLNRHNAAAAHHACNSRRRNGSRRQPGVTPTNSRDW